jgi:hypothetical protein
MSKTKDKKYKHLFLGLLFDAIGMLSFAVPFLGDFSDVLWAPLAGWIITRMYKGKIGQAAGIIAFVEEIIPGLDIVPTFTIMWFYTYVIKNNKGEKTVEV